MLLPNEEDLFLPIREPEDPDSHHSLVPSYILKRQSDTSHTLEIGETLLLKPSSGTFEPLIEDTLNH